jgi:WD40 repeat protein
VAFSGDGKWLASGDESGEVRVWDAAGGRPVGQFKGHAMRVMALAFSPDGKTLLSGAADRTVWTWRLP